MGGGGRWVANPRHPARNSTRAVFVVVNQWRAKNERGCLWANEFTRESCDFEFPLAVEDKFDLDAGELHD